MSTSLFSPTLTASTNNDDIDMTLPLSQDKGLDNFEALFNFDEYGSLGDASSHTHSPTTASPNSTPSPLPLPVQEPITFNPENFGFLANDASMDFPLDFSFGNEVKSGPVVPEEIVQVKQEPMEFNFGELSNSQSPITQARPMPVPQPLLQQDTTIKTDNFVGLPDDQQAALQQLMANLIKYQQTYGLDIAGTRAAEPVPAAPPAPSTIQPSMIFGSATSPSTSTFTQTHAISMQGSPIKQTSTMTTTPAEDDEPLRSVEPHEMSATAGPSRSTRQESVVSSGFEDLDTKIDRLVPLNTIFSAGKGKGGKKGGGMSSVVRNDDEDLDVDESWRPSPEEYKKLSSKEKRQLRNKLSARAFRTRRKDYIGTLESHIQDRDVVIDEMRSELVNFRSENQDLRRELAALKASTMSILHPESATKSSVSPAMVSALTMSPSLPPLSPTTNAVAGPGPNTTRRSATPLSTFNPRKDLPASIKGQWGGNDNMFGGGSTICHTMFTPDLVLPSASSTPAPLRSLADLPRVNINPHLNDDSTTRGHMLAGLGNGQDTSKTFSNWSEETPFSLRSMDSYRMQMWSRLAREAAADKANITGDMRPKFFVEVKDEPQSPTSSAAAALAASVASTHITSKLANSFFSAFQGTGTKLDTDKLAAVVTGQAKLKVVPAESSSDFTYSSSTAEVNHNEDCLSMLMGGLKLQSGPGLRSPGVGARENPLGTLCGFLTRTSAPTRA
ncbi:uncharacterized protein I303_102013 [Kwoniella dejecticola CBS 10117]|uniref:BZIP domain-containing protein n=1 Tax=Kwoniella dejecticola CBS 10117 TaxID=1296121 RepID=A0A1A6AC44_9TREE|nr:uncharacterized protein I303_01849 [Kwoniella dejecticola CBS 10117]OBR87641.1 hypothetical protein I303_01849 [Kwoniella dejecticola CBS 10117]